MGGFNCPVYSRHGHTKDEASHGRLLINNESAIITCVCLCSSGELHPINVAAMLNKNRGLEGKFERIKLDIR